MCLARMCSATRHGLAIFQGFPSRYVQACYRATGKDDEKYYVSPSSEKFGPATSSGLANYFSIAGTGHLYWSVSGSSSTDDASLTQPTTPTAINATETEGTDPHMGTGGGISSGSIA